MTSAGTGAAKPVHRRAILIVAATLAALVAIVVAIDSQRTVIAQRLARDWLSKHKVAARLEVRSISLTGLSAHLSVGDPADPDLSVERIDVGYALTGPWTGAALGVQTGSLRLVRPRLKLRLVDGRIDFGAVKPLIDEIAKLPPGRAPDVAIEDGRVVLLTPGGQLAARGEVTLRTGNLEKLDAKVDPFRVTVSGVSLRGAGGAIRFAHRGSALVAAMDLGPTGAIIGANQATASKVTLNGEFPYPTNGGRIVGTGRLNLIATDVAAFARKDRATGGAVTIALDGALDVTTARWLFNGHGSASGHLAAVGVQNARAQDLVGRLELAQLSLAGAPGGLIARGAGQANLSGRGLDAGGVSGVIQSMTIQLRGGQAAMQNGRTTVSALVDGTLAGRGVVDVATARRWTQGIPDAATAAAAQRALRAFRYAAPRWRAELSDRGGSFMLLTPLRLDAESGAHVSLAGRAGGNSSRFLGSGDMTVTGGGLPALRVQLANAVISGTDAQAELAAAGAIDTPTLQGVRLQVKGRLASSGARVTLSLAGCAPLSARRLAIDQNAVTDFAAALCPGAAPLIEVSRQGWRAEGRLQGVRGDMATIAADLRGADAVFMAHGAGAATTATLVLQRGEIVDTSDPIRFEPVHTAGRAVLTGMVLSGDFTGATGSGHRIGTLRLRQDLTSGEGRADIDATDLVFTPNGLQPGELSPSVALLRQANGPVAFKGSYAWRKSGPLTSGGELTARGLKFSSPLGPVLGLDGDVHFTSLSPLVTAADQSIAVSQVQALLPVIDLSSRFTLAPETIAIGAAGAGVAKGRIRLEPLVAPLDPKATVKGVLVLDHVDLGQIIATSSLADAVKTDAVVDGRIPFAWGPSGLTIQQGRLAAVRPGRISISRQALTGGAKSATPGAAAVSGQAAFAQDLAYQAMENLAFDQLDASMNSVAGDRLSVLFHINGRHDPPQKQRAVIAVGDLLGGRALAKPLALPSGTKINLTLDTSLNFGELVRELRQMWRESLGAAAPPRHSASVQATGALMKTK